MFWLCHFLCYGFFFFLYIWFGVSCHYLFCFEKPLLIYASCLCLSPSSVISIGFTSFLLTFPVVYCSCYGVFVSVHWLFLLFFGILLACLSLVCSTPCNKCMLKAYIICEMVRSPPDCFLVCCSYSIQHTLVPTAVNKRFVFLCKEWH